MRRCTTRTSSWCPRSWSRGRAGCTVQTSFPDLTIHAALDALASGTATSESLVEDLIATKEAREPQVDAYIHFDAETARAEARAADQRRAAGETGALLGIPIAVKDVLNVKGQPCTCGSRILDGYTALYDATAVARLRAAGAVLAGRTNMDEFAMGSSTEGSAFKVTRNPWNADYVPGGSSGGSAAAVAAGAALAALGSDTGGSIRQPASFCGCVGLKPSYGRVSRYGLTAYASSLDQVGPVARDVRDAAILLGAIAGLDPMDSTSVDREVPDFQSALTGDLDGVRIGLPQEYFVEGMDPEVESAVRAAIDHCAKLGAETVPVTMPHTEYAVATYYIIATAEASANLSRFDGVRYGTRAEDASDPIDMYGRTRAAGFGAEVKRRIILGTYVLSSGYYDAYYLTAQKVRTLIRDDFAHAFETCDVLMAPVSPTPAYRIGAMADNPLQMYLGDILTSTANLAGICGLSLPCGFTGTGLPIGLQVLGPAYGEDRILRAAYAYEQSSDWHQRKPDLGGGATNG
jgi:aspartyl-tRNA(Asn)/glutamyl-tRNA(Gln) amidotransferase subunit A